MQNGNDKDAQHQPVDTLFVILQDDDKYTRMTSILLNPDEKQDIDRSRTTHMLKFRWSIC